MNDEKRPDEFTSCAQGTIFDFEQVFAHWIMVIRFIVNLL